MTDLNLRKMAENIWKFVDEVCPHSAYHHCLECSIPAIESALREVDKEAIIKLCERLELRS